MLKAKKEAAQRAGRAASNETIDLMLFYRDRKLTASETNIVRLIPEGADHKITMPDLASFAHTSTRAVQDTIYKAKMKGVPVCCSRKSGDSGYYIATTEAERKQGLRNLKHQATKILEGVNGVSNASLTNWKKLTGFDEVVK